MSISLDVASIVREEKAFTTTTDLNNITSQNETPLLLFKNPSGSDIRMLVTHFLIGADSSNARTTYRIYADATVTADGTSIVIANTYLKDTYVYTTAAEAYKLPTISANGTRLNMAIAPADTPSRGINRFYWMDPGHNLLVTVENSVSNTDCFGDIYWLEDI